jgi:hypothetical protein
MEMTKDELEDMLGFEHKLVKLLSQHQEFLVDPGNRDVRSKYLEAISSVRDHVTKLERELSSLRDDDEFDCNDLLCIFTKMRELQREVNRRKLAQIQRLIKDIKHD